MAWPFSSANRPDILNQRSAFLADRLEIDRIDGIENQPGDIGAIEQCRRHYRGE